jgi:hypothetical protein
MADTSTITDLLDTLLTELRGLRADVAALRGLRPGPAPSPTLDVPFAALLESAALATWGSSAEVPAAAYATMPPGHPVADALASFARARNIAPPVGAVAVGALLARAAALPGSRLRYRRMTAGGRWRVVDG